MAEKHFYEQKKYTKEYLVPYFQKHIPEFHKKKILEVGCAEGGLLEVLQEIGIDAAGLEISEERVEISKRKNPNLEIMVGDITNPNLTSRGNGNFDVVIMREVIEHLPDKKTAMENISKLLNREGYLFISFPPKYSPFAGHQQIGRSFLRVIPYLHILPKSFIKTVANLLSEDDGYIDEIKLHFSTGCTIKEFESLSKFQKFAVIKRDLFLFRPIYAYRFNLPTINFPNIPIVREYFSFGCESLLQKKY